MKVGILGTGDVGQALGRGFLALGHEVCLAGRDTRNEKAQSWLKTADSPKATIGTFTDAAEFGDIVVLATLGTATPNALKLGGIENFKGKLVLDATNPLDNSLGMPPKLIGGVGDSGGEINQRAIPQAHVVKVFNTVGNAFMFKPKFQSQPTMFICGNEQAAKIKTTEICRDFGWETMDVGDITSSHYLECMCMVWVLTAIQTGQWNQAFKMLRG